MTLQPGIVDALDPGMALQELRDGQRVRAMPLHPQRQRLDSAQCQKGIERRGNASQSVLQVLQALLQRSVGAHDRSAAEGVGVPVQVLCRRMHDDVAAEFQRPLNERRRESIVADREQAVAPGEIGHRPQINQFQQRVGRCLYPDEARVRPDRTLERRAVRQIDERHLVPGRTLAHVLEDPVAASVQVMHRDDMRPGIEQLEHGGGRCHTGGKRKCRSPALEICHRRLKRIAGWVSGACVVIALVHSGAGLDVSGGGVNGSHHGPRERIRMLAAVNDAGPETVPA